MKLYYQANFQDYKLFLCIVGRFYEPFHSFFIKHLTFTHKKPLPILHSLTQEIGKFKLNNLVLIMIENISTNLRKRIGIIINKKLQSRHLILSGLQRIKFHHGFITHYCFETEGKCFFCMIFKFSFILSGWDEKNYFQEPVLR